MRARTTVLGVAASALILAGGWELGMRANQAALVPTSAAASPRRPVAVGADPSASASAGTPSTGAPKSGATPTASSVQAPTIVSVGASEATQYGAVQVEIKVRAGRIIDVVALHLTDSNGRSVAISNQAAPILRSEVLQSQSAKVQAVSGATYTTDGYLRSVQSALDRAGL